jgi:hypothetical protein
MFNLQWIDLCYRVGDKENATAVYTLFLQDLEDCYRFYSRQSGFAKYFGADKAAAEEYVMRLEYMANTYQDSQLLDMLNKKFPSLITTTQQPLMNITPNSNQ